MSEFAALARFIDDGPGTGRGRGEACRSPEWRAAVWLLLGLIWLLGGRPLLAQQPAAAAQGSISGRVVDAESLVPLEGATVQLERIGERSVSLVQSQLTDGSGGYRFERLPSARYRLVVERIGYLANAVEVDLRPDRIERVSVGLSLQPVELAPLEVTGRQTQPYTAAHSPTEPVIGARVAVARRTQEEFLVSDARRLTQAEVLEAVTLGEPDLFRALQRVPGVTTRDDYTATLWTRGATWDQTRVYFDGLPLFNPTHAGWLFSAVNSDAVGDVAFQPGHRSAALAEGNAAILDLKSRSGGRRGEFSGRAEISPVSARVALDGQALGGQLGWMVAARRTYVDVLTKLVESTLGGELAVPYDFADVVARVDGEIGMGWGYEASMILEMDHLRGDIPGLLQGNRGRWGNRAGQITLRVPLGPWQARVSTGETRFSTRLDELEQLGAAGKAVTLPELENSIRHRMIGVRVGPAQGDPNRWSLGYQFVRDTVSYNGPFSLIGVLTALEDTDSLSRVPWSRQSRLQYAALWGERRWRPVPGLTLATGVRTEFGDSVYYGGRLRWSPRAAARYQIDPATTMSASWTRSFQYTQDVAPAAGPIGPQLHLSAIWVLASRSRNYPAARADIATLGLERWIGEEWQATATAYHRAALGIKVPNPDTGRVTPGRDPDAVAENEARGLEVSLRRLQGKWTGSIGYSMGVSDLVSRVAVTDFDTITYRFPSSADVRHALDVTLMAQVAEGVQMGGAFTYGSGVPFTRLVLADPNRPTVPPRLEHPNAERTPSYASLDLMLDYTRTVGSWQVSGYAQLRNALDRDNAVTYSGSVDCGAPTALAALQARRLECDGRNGIQDFFEPGLPRLPLFGIRVAF